MGSKARRRTKAFRRKRQHFGPGLGFGACVIMDASPESYPANTEYDTRLLHVAASGGLHHLAFWSEAGFHPLVEGTAAD